MSKANIIGIACTICLTVLMLIVNVIVASYDKEVFLYITLPLSILCCCLAPPVLAGCGLVTARNRKTDVEEGVYAARHRAEQRVSALARGEQPMMPPRAPGMRPAPTAHPLYQESAGNQIAPK